MSGQEKGRLRVLRGSDTGKVFVFYKDQITIGRGEPNDVALLDGRTSRNHAEIGCYGGEWRLSDAGSANGTFHDGKSITSVALKNGDVFTVGETVFAFELSARQLGPVAPGGGLGWIPAEGEAAAGSSTKNRVLLGALAAVIGVLIFGDSGKDAEKDPDKSANKMSARNPAQDTGGDASSASLGKFLPTGPRVNRIQNSIDMFLRAGLREYREKNYLRAIEYFERVVQLDASHGIARLYLSHSKKEMEDEIESYLTNGKRKMDLGKWRDAYGHFSSVLRILAERPEHPSAVEARKNLEILEERRKGARF